MPILLILLALVLIFFLIVVWRSHRELKREAFIRNYSFPHGLFERLCKQHPQLSLKDCQLVANGLRQFFLVYLGSGQQYVSMPSQVVDDLWHEFILHTRNYQDFCQQAFGSFFHHTPAVAVDSSTQANLGLQRCWQAACREEHINPHRPTRLPLLFALDGKLQIVGGFFYAANCRGVQGTESGATGTPYCGGDLSGCGGGACGGGSGDGGSSDGGGDGGGCGGGCGGGGGD